MYGSIENTRASACAKLLATADKRGIKENIEEIHDFSKINMVVPHNV